MSIIGQSACPGNTNKEDLNILKIICPLQVLSYLLERGAQEDDLTSLQTGNVSILYFIEN